jgi:hypothetical protein
MVKVKPGAKVITIELVGTLQRLSGLLSFSKRAMLWQAF